MKQLLGCLLLLPNLFLCAMEQLGQLQSEQSSKSRSSSDTITEVLKEVKNMPSPASREIVRNASGTPSLLPPIRRRMPRILLDDDGQLSTLSATSCCMVGLLTAASGGASLLAFPVNTCTCTAGATLCTAGWLCVFTGCLFLTNGCERCCCCNKKG